MILTTRLSTHFISMPKLLSIPLFGNLMNLSKCSKTLTALKNLSFFHPYLFFTFLNSEVQGWISYVISKFPEVEIPWGEGKEGGTIFSLSSQEAAAHCKSERGFWLLKINPGPQPALHINLTNRCRLAHTLSAPCWDPASLTRFNSEIL